MTENIYFDEIHTNERCLESNMEIEMEKNCKSLIPDDDEEELFTVTKKRIQTFSDSESDLDKEIDEVVEKDTLSNNSEKSSDNEEVTSSPTLTNKRFRIKNQQNSDSDHESSQDIISNGKQKLYESVRTEMKKKNLKEKFKSLLSSKSKEAEKVSQSDLNNTDDLDEDSYCLEIKQILRTSVNPMNSICDPDTSDEDSDREKNINRKKHKSKAVKSTLAKPLRMSAKQAMENMQKIKSESNRMLREKEVSLPYHKPKALSLKDIMSRRKPAVTSDGKALPIKMNEEQLKQYAMMLEQRQKEVIELCKSDSDEEENEQENKENVESDTVDLKLNTESTNTLQNTVNENDLSFHNDKLFDLSGEQDNSHNVKHIDASDIETIKEQDIDTITEEIQTAKENEVENNIIVNNINEQEQIECMDVSVEDVQQNDVKDTSNRETESQVMNLHYESEKVDSFCEKDINKNTNIDQLDIDNINKNYSKDQDSFEDELNYDKIEKIICDINKKTDDTLAVNGPLNINPKLTGCPGSFINLDDSDPSGPRKLSGVEMLKERFTYFAKLNALEDTNKEREKKYKPGTQHLKLKQALEQEIAEQRSMEWEKRLEEEKQLKSEMNGDLSDDDIEKMEAKLEVTEAEEKVDESSESEEEPMEDDIILEDKPKKRNPMVDDEAEESECDDDVIADEEEITDDVKDAEANDADLEDSDDESSDSSESEEEVESKPRKGRILKAFEDSDNESAMNNQDILINNEETDITKDASKTIDEEDIIKETQDDDLQLAQANKSSDDLFSTQESNTLTLGTLNKNSEDNISADLGTQSFSIMNSEGTNHQTINLNSQENLSIVCETQSQEESNMDHVVVMCSGSFSQNIVSLQNPPALSQSQEIGDDVAALCTGKFYDNPFVSQVDKKNMDEELQLTISNENSQSQEIGDDVAALCTGKFYDNQFVSQNCDNNKPLNTETMKNTETSEQKGDKENTILKSILDELDEPELDVPKNKYFLNTQPKNSVNIDGSQLKKKFVIDSDDEIDDSVPSKKTKKLKKRKAEHRALQISDDEEEDVEEEENLESEIEEEEDRIVEYDSEENEVEVQLKPLKKKRVGEFFENEAELTSEDEWVGSGDEDEKGLDRMEREEGDNDVFHQGQLQRELGQIHMREVLDQDKREVRLLQELLFEDGDLGDGHRQRKFRWRNADGELETGTNPDEFHDTQEDEFESEEQWRKQRHEREMFLRKMQETDQENLDISINRTTIIKANLNSRSMSTLISETKVNMTENVDNIVPEKKSAKDMPSPKKPFTIFQQNYHGSLLTRGRGALARLAALATPLATDNDDAPKVIASTNRRNFVFAAVTADEEPKVAKRKAEKINTPRLIKKMKTDETTKHIKNSLFDHLKT